MEAVRYLPKTPWTWSRETEVVIVGAGAAGKSAALELARRGVRVIVLCKSAVAGGSTLLAQGGLAVVTGESDSIDAHVDDTLIAAAGLAHPAAVRELVTGAPEIVNFLKCEGARFDGGPLGLEGGHSHHRIIHAGGDAIGAELDRTLTSSLRGTDVEFLENTVAIDAIQDSRGGVFGVVAGVRRGDDANQLDCGTIFAKAVVLATGGIGQAFATTTNPVDVTGDGLAMAIRAGAELANVEFVQFHPTVLYTPRASGPSALITEALRGAGAAIVDRDGSPVMRRRHPLGDLAPRDVVSFTMSERMGSSSDPLDHLWLDARSLGHVRLARDFPTVHELCRRGGFDLASERVPIAPGAHYSCGGVRADLNGVTSLAGLYAIGEAAATGVHGANRLASNSLTEAVHCGRRLARFLCDTGVHERPLHRHQVSAPQPGTGIDPRTRRRSADMMSTHVGVIRRGDALRMVLGELGETRSSREATLDLPTLEATNLHTVSLVVTYAAHLREESRGCHRRLDYPDASASWRRDTVLTVVAGALTERFITREVK